jgi:hypothetical protein
MDKFWKKVVKCKHKNLSTSYYVSLDCSTPYCEGAEMRCLDCKAYITTCGCGDRNDVSGWPRNRRATKYKKTTLQQK